MKEKNNATSKRDMGRWWRCQQKKWSKEENKRQRFAFPTKLITITYQPINSYFVKLVMVDRVAIHNVTNMLKQPGERERSKGKKISQFLCSQNTSFVGCSSSFWQRKDIFMCNCCTLKRVPCTSNKQKWNK